MLPRVALRDRNRVLREAQWSDDLTLEAEVLEPYLAEISSGKPSRIQIARLHGQYLDRSRKQVDTILQTNDQLQEMLKAQETIIREVESTVEEKQEEWDEIKVQLDEGKDEHRQVKMQLRTLREQWISEESRLGTRQNDLHTRVIQLTAENHRLEKLRGEEELQLGKQRAAIAGLSKVIATLDKKKAHYELQGHEIDRDLETARYPGEQHFHHAPNDEDVSEIDYDSGSD